MTDPESKRRRLLEALLEDEVLITEVQRRVARDNGNRHSLDEVMARLGITREELEEEE